MGQWRYLNKQVCDKLDLAAKFNCSTTFNAAGSAALSTVIKAMSDTIDNEIARQQAKRRSFRLLGFTLTISRNA